MGQWSDPYNIVGFAGGVVLATALLPQIYLAHSRKSTADISYMWQAVYTVGLLTLIVYYAHFSLWAVFYPMAFEFACLMYLTGLKIYYDVVKKVTASSLPIRAPEFDMSRSGRVGRMPSKLAMEAISDASMNGRIGRMLSDASKSGRMSRVVSGAAAVDDNGRTETMKPPPPVRKPAGASLIGDKVEANASLNGVV